MAKYELKPGVFCTHYGPANIIDENNMTDALAEHLIKKGILKKTDFKTKTKK